MEMKISEKYIFLNDDGKLQQKIRNKCINASQEGLEVLMTIDEICELMIEATIVSSQWNIHEYHLARNNDTGNYFKSNCKFIPCSENYSQRKISPAMIASAKENVKLATKKSPTNLQSIGGKVSGSIKRECPHCGKIGKSSAMFRYHFDRCPSR